MRATALLTNAVPALLLAVLHHHVRGPSGDYAGLFLAAGASWAGLPGPGEAALIAAAILAAHHHLDIVSVVAVAWLGATVGGIVGWLIALKAGRAAMTIRGPLLRARLAALERGDRFFARYGPLAVFLTPSWVAGIHGMRPSRYLPANALAALTWAFGIGLGGYYVGPSVIDLVGDAGLAGGAAIGLVLVVGVVLGLRRRHRARRLTRD